MQKAAMCLVLVAAVLSGCATSTRITRPVFDATGRQVGSVEVDSRSDAQGAAIVRSADTRAVEGQTAGDIAREAVRTGQPVSMHSTPHGVSGVMSTSRSR